MVITRTILIPAFLACMHGCSAESAVPDDIRRALTICESGELVGMTLDAANSRLGLGTGMWSASLWYDIDPSRAGSQVRVLMDRAFVVKDIEYTFPPIDSRGMISRNTEDLYKLWKTGTPTEKAAVITLLHERESLVGLSYLEAVELLGPPDVPCTGINYITRSYSEDSALLVYLFLSCDGKVTGCDAGLVDEDDYD